MRGWAPLLLLPAAALLLPSREWPAWARMWTLALAIYAGCKWLTWRRTPMADAPAWRQAAYLLAWPGMDAREFVDPHSRIAPPSAREWFAGAAALVVGTVLCFGVARRVPRDHAWLAGWIGMVALVLMLHFGSFRLLSCAWRRVGVAARPLMDRPLAATGLGEFWARRWNTAFRDLTHRFLFRPLGRRFGPRLGIAAGFLASGLVHDLVISLPARGGYGGPTLYFVVQGTALLLERSGLGVRLGLGTGWRGRAFELLVVMLPAPLLFHPPFVGGVIVPFLQAAGALP